MSIKTEQVTEWTENPVTIALKELAESELQDIQDTPLTDCLISGHPDKTFENLIELEARERVWESWVAILSGDWDYFVEEEDED